MSLEVAKQPTAPAPFEEKKKMPKRLSILTSLCLALIALALPVASASAASPWWQVLDGSRPSHLWEGGDSVQEIVTTMGEVPGAPEFGEGTVQKLEVNGEFLACLGSQTFLGEFGCGAFYGKEATATAEQLKAVLEPVYGPDVEVEGGPVGVAPLVVTVPGRGAPPISFYKPTQKEIENGEAQGTFGTATATVLSPGGSGALVITATNLGDATVNATANPVVIKDRLPEGVIATGAEGEAGVFGEFGKLDCAVEASGEEVTCTFEGLLPPYEALEAEIFVAVAGSPPVQGAPGAISVSGGNAEPASSPQNVIISPDPVPFGVERFSAQSEEEGGAVARHAGGHPFQFTTTIQLNAGRMVGIGSGRRMEQPGLPRNLRFPLPAGLVGNTTLVPRCSMADFLTHDATRSVLFNNRCEAESAIGVASVTAIVPGTHGFLHESVPVFNLPPAHGEPARFGIMPGGDPVVIDTAFDPDTHRISALVRNTTEAAQFLSSTLSIWGYPGDPRHDNARGWECTFNIDPGNTNPLGPKNPLGPCERPAGIPDVALMRQPVSCNGPLEFGVEVEPWNVPLGSQVATASFTGEPLLGCNKVPVDPTIVAAPTSKLAETPTGLSFQLTMPHAGLLKPEAIAEGQPKKVEVTLPEGMTINPSAAEGLAVCSLADYARERDDSKPGEGCPEASKLGNVTIQTPLIEEPVKGALYQATPHDNPFDSLLGLYLIARVPERGILLKLAGRVDTNERSGRIVTTFDDAPPLPFDSFDLQFREGGRAPLVTPPACGDYEIVARFSPWSAQNPDNPAPDEIITRTSTFTVQRGVDGGACPTGSPPFRPGFEAGSLNNAAGRYSPFYMRLTRRDGDQDLTKFSSVLPEGALAKLAGVTRCPQASVEAAKGRQGAAEKASPSCPASSQIGRTSVGAGVGSILTYVPGQLYLGGSYHGAPLSVVSITPAVAGPFDLGTVVVQEGLKLDPATGEVQVDGGSSDPIPHILEGVPLKVRDLRVYVDRDQFTTTPTSCDPMATKAALFGSGLDVFSPGDDVQANLSARYQAASCERLGFKPRVQLRLSGRRSTRGANPALRAVLRPRLGDANSEQIQVALPGSELLEQSHIRTICTRVQFAAGAGFGAACPPGSVYGHVKAWTPLLDEPLEGPVYLRSSNHVLPDMVLALHGLVDIESVGRIDSINGRIRSTFENVPDAPLSKVVLEMQGGRKGLLVNSTDICRGVHRAKAIFTGQNGKRYTSAPKVAAKCGGRKHRKK